MITNLRIFSLLFIFLIVVTSCQKEIGFGTGIDTPAGTNSGTAKYSLSGVPGNCTGAIVSGSWKAGAALPDTNTVKIKVIVDSVGTYNITTASANGISFAASGTFASTGEQTVILKASGIPAAAGSFNYTAGANGCIFTITVIGGVVPPPVTGECKSCSYIPVCVGTKYTYEIDNNGSVLTLVEELLAPETDTTVNGVVYKKIQAKYDYSNGTSNKNFGYYNCTNNTTTVFAYQVTSVSGNSTVEFMKSTILKANEPAMATWQDVITNQGGQQVTMTFTLAEKDISHTVLGKTFDSVMHVSYVQTVNLLGTEIETGTGDYYYAKNIGLIDNSSITLGVIGTWKLKEYYIP